jgi:hypothetical protein
MNETTKIILKSLKNLHKSVSEIENKLSELEDRAYWYFESIGSDYSDDKNSPQIYIEENQNSASSIKNDIENVINFIKHPNKFYNINWINKEFKKYPSSSKTKPIALKLRHAKLRSLK